MKSKFSFVLTLFSTMLLLCIGFLLLTFAEKESRPSGNENRMLQGFPELSGENILSGNMSGEFENFLSDGFFARNLLIGVSDNCLGVFSCQTEEDIALLEGGNDELQGLVDGQTGTSDDEQPEGGAVQTAPDNDGADSAPGDSAPADDENYDELPEDGGELEEVDPDSAAQSENYGFYFRKANGKLGMVFTTLESNRRKTARALNAYRAELPEDGNVFYMMIPLKRNYSPIRNDDKYVGWYSNVEDSLREQTVDGVHVLNVPEILEPHLDEDIYFPIDHHWSALGAYYVCEELMRIQGLPMAPYEEYNYKKVYGHNYNTGVKGWFDIIYPLQKVNTTKVYQKVKEMDAVFVDYSSEFYTAFFNGRILPWTKIETGYSTGRKALVIGDSFANIFTPYLCPYYDEVHMTDVRENHYDQRECGGWIADLIEYHGIDDVYILMSYANAANSPTSYKRLEQCLHG